MTGDPAAQQRVDLGNPQSWTDTPQLPTLGRTLDAAVGHAVDIVDRADREHPGAVARFALFSGGDDSSVMLELTRHGCDAVVHINTGIGVAQTRDFVRARVAELGLDLIEVHPPGVTYRELVLAHGFPGPAAHLYMYRHLKERAIRKLVRETLGPGRSERVIFYSGVRAAESARRRRNFAGRDIERDGRTVWVAPVVDFTVAEMAAYQARFSTRRTRSPRTCT